MNRLKMTAVIAVAVAALCTPGAAQAVGGVDSPKVSAQQAMDVVKQRAPQLVADLGVVRYSKKGEATMEVTLRLGEAVVSRLRVNPESGEILPKGYRAWSPKVAVTPDQARGAVRAAIPKFTVGNPWQSVNGRWKVPLVLKGSVVAEIRVDGGTGAVVSENAK